MGFFQIKNHGISMQEISDAFEQSERYVCTVCMYVCMYVCIKCMYYKSNTICLNISVHVVYFININLSK